MKIQGKVLKVHETETVGKNETEKRTVLIETDSDSKFPKQLALTFWKDMAKMSFNVGEVCTFEIDLESREYNGKYYTDAKCFRVEKNQFP